MITLTEIHDFAVKNKACFGELDSFNMAFNSGDIIKAWQIVIWNMKWLNHKGLTIDKSDIPKEVNGKCEIVDYLKIKTIFRIKNFKLDGQVKVYDRLGNTMVEYAMKNGLVHGKTIRYGYDGFIQYIIHHKNGITHGIAKYYTDNKLTMSKMYMNGKSHGKEKQYFTNGKICTNKTYVDGVLNGQYYLYSPNGKINLIGEYKDGYLDGDVQLYDKNGIFQTTEKYSMGIKIG